MQKRYPPETSKSARSRWPLLLPAVLGAGALLILILLLALYAPPPVLRPPALAQQPTPPPASPAQAAAISITVDTVVASGFQRPVQVTHAGDGSNRLFVVEKGGRIRIIREGTVLSQPFLDISDLVDSDAYERGLLGLAFHPQYADNGYFFVNYTQAGGDTVIARYTVSSDPDRADRGSGIVILVVDQPYSNHNGGQVTFGPDGYLYAGMGDGGSAGDPQNHAQDNTTLLGAMLRISVGHTLPYTIPPDNPYVGTSGADEIWAIGLRNPWRFSFDRATGDLYIGDVGQNAWEEIDYLPAGAPGGTNFGWRCLEGTHTYNTQPPCDDPDHLATLTPPIAEYPHIEGRSVTGGFVYRGQDYPDLTGRYFYGDYIEGKIWSLYRTNAGTWSTPELELDVSFAVSAFGEDEQGELYVVDDSNGAIRRLADARGPAPDLSASRKSAAPDSADPGETVTYTLALVNTGGTSPADLVVTDTLPAGLAYEPGSLAAPEGTVDDSLAPTLRWQGVFSTQGRLTITYRATVTGTAGSYVNRARIRGAVIRPVTLSHALFVPRSPLTTTPEDFVLPGTQPDSLEDDVAGSLDCDTCHTAPIYDRWRGSMMSQSGRDPLLWAALAVANHDAPGAGEYCVRCHVPQGWLEGRSHPADGSALLGDDLQTGVACAVCHRLVDPRPSTAPTDETAQIDAEIRQALTTTVPADNPGSATMIVDPQDRRRGPFAFDPSLPFHSAYRSSFFEGTDYYFTASRLCGTCHNVDNPVLSWDPAREQFWPNEHGSPAPATTIEDGQLFPIETTFDEWALSAYATGAGVYAPPFAGDKPDGIVRSCQDCHMPRTTGLAADAQFDPVFRDCVDTGCLPVHELVGGNTWIPQILQDTRWRLDSTPDAAYLDATAGRARQMLRRAATLTVTLESSGTSKIARVRVTNQTGHKLPTGYPEGRRMWLHVQAFDGTGTLVYESGAYDPATAILSEDPDVKVYEAKQGLTPELAEALGRPELAGESFHFVLNNTVVKDNRIPPRGYRQTAWDRPGLRPVGATYADGQYWDDATYVLPGTVARVRVTLYYQTASKAYVDFLRRYGGLDGQALGTLWEASKSPPEVMAQAWTPHYPAFLPLLLELGGLSRPPNSDP